MPSSDVYSHKLNNNKSHLDENHIKSMWQEKKSDTYSAYSTDELHLVEGIFIKILHNDITDSIKQQMLKMNLHITQTGKYLIISEANPPYTGQGMYIINIESSSKILLQAPHAFHDLKSGSIAIKLFLENNISALAINSLNRYYTSIKGEKKSADMAHLSNSLYMAFSRAYIKVFNKSRTIQLHGFNADKYPATKPLNFILSNGTRAFDQSLINQRDCLENKLKLKSHVYALNINILGGTKNSIGHVLRHSSYTGFEHIEMSLPVRKRLNRSSVTRQQFMSCISL